MNSDLDARPNWEMALVGVVFVGIGVAVIVHRKTIARGRGWKYLHLRESVLAGMLIALGVGFILFGLFAIVIGAAFELRLLH